MFGEGNEEGETMKALVCCENYYLCKVKHRCDDEPECHALARAVMGSMENKYCTRRCHVVYDGGVFRYEFEMLPTYDFTRAIKRLWKERNKKKKEK